MKTCKNNHEYNPGKGCPKCIQMSKNKYRKTWLAKRPDYMPTYRAEFKKRRPNYHVSWKTGVPETDIEILRKKQGDICAICSKPLKKSVVDHCHSSGKVRGILCYPCNILLGQANDNIEILEQAITYLKNNG